MIFNRFIKVGDIDKNLLGFIFVLFEKVLMIFFVIEDDFFQLVRLELVVEFLDKIDLFIHSLAIKIIQSSLNFIKRILFINSSNRLIKFNSSQNFYNSHLYDLYRVIYSVHIQLID